MEARGKYLIPGLWDMHAHPSLGGREVFYPLFIAAGVTGIRDAHSGWEPVDTGVQWWQAILAGVRVGPPRQLLTGPQELFEPLEEDIAARKAHGANFLKLYWFRPDLAAAARRAGLPFGGHVMGGESWDEPGAAALEASDSVSSIIDHVHSNGSGGLSTVCLGAKANVERCRLLAERFRQNSTWWVPTLIVYKELILEEGYLGPAAEAIYQRWAGFDSTFWSADTVLRRPQARPSMRPAAGGGLQIARQVGLPFLAGTDMPVAEPAGFSLHGELELFVAGGLTPLEALQTATLNPAKMLHATDSLGTVAAGKLADLVLLDADPLADITNTLAIRAVVANGRYFDRAALDQLLAKAKRKGRPR